VCVFVCVCVCVHVRVWMCVYMRVPQRWWGHAAPEDPGGLYMSGQ